MMNIKENKWRYIISPKCKITTFVKCKITTYEKYKPSKGIIGIREALEQNTNTFII